MYNPIVPYPPPVQPGGYRTPAMRRDAEDRYYEQFSGEFALPGLSLIRGFYRALRKPFQKPPQICDDLPEGDPSCTSGCR